MQPRRGGDGERESESAGGLWSFKGSCRARLHISRGGDNSDETKLEIDARQLALEEEKFGQPQLSIILPEQQGDVYFQHFLRYLIWMLGKLNEL